MDNTKESTSYNIPKVLGIQDYLSVGYIFLLILGIVHESIYYNFIGVNILDYSSILDVLISPVAIIAGNFVLAIAVIIVVFLSLLYLKITPKYYNWLGKKQKFQHGKNKELIEKYQAMLKNRNGPLLFISVLIFSLFVGLGIGRGHKTKQRIATKDFELSHIINFERGGRQKVKLLGKNSLYVFYVTMEEDEVVIAPIQGNITRIQKLKIEKEPSSPTEEVN